MENQDSAPDTDSANDAWLSQTVGGPCPDQTGTLGRRTKPIFAILELMKMHTLSSSP
jgi:hypothetical protein